MSRNINSKSKTIIFPRFITHNMKHFMPVNLDGLQRIKIQNPKSQNIKILLKTIK